MTKYGDLKVGHEFSRSDWEFSVRKGRGHDTVLETGVGSPPLGDDEEVTLLNPDVKLSDVPTDVERAAVALLTHSYTENWLLSAYIDALAADPDEFRPLDIFVAQTPETWVGIDERGYVGPKSLSRTEPSAFAAIWGRTPKGEEVTGDDRLQADLEAAQLVLAKAVVDYRADGRPDAQSSHLGPTTVHTSLAAEIANFHYMVARIYEQRIVALEDSRKNG